MGRGAGALIEVGQTGAVLMVLGTGTVFVLAFQLFYFTGIATILYTFDAFENGMSLNLDD